MAYYSGTASSLTNLRTALLTHAQADGWALTGDVLSKAGVFFRVQETATNITCLGCEDNAVSNPAPSVVMIGQIRVSSGSPTREIVYPCSYEVFGFAQELYLIVNYDSDTYQWMAFGKSTVSGLPGQGGWCGATSGGPFISNIGGAGPFELYQNGISSLTAPSNITGLAGVLFGTIYTHGASGGYPPMNCWCNSNLDGTGWLPAASGASYEGFESLQSIRELLWQQPSAWNTEAALLPICAWKHRAAWKLSLVADLEHARHLRIDNLAPGDVLTLGPDRWKVFPWYRKDAAARNGGLQVNHTGTFGWAIRYEGP